ncbi:tetratricopeptide repeat protein [Aerosakkonemataceae cyanobacterium BLCC-F50]|uniref:Tetratricopeptide repeat protein n=1 Tax=Floridaenema flaviceps BLCC-F50 TaxID=3153642 RepID=A0ABV4XTZ9_9CYAN
MAFGGESKPDWWSIFTTQIKKVIAGWKEGLYKEFLSFKERYKLYEEILKSEIGEEENILQKNSALIDKKFVAIMKHYWVNKKSFKAVYGEQKVEKLKSLATQLENTITHEYQQKPEVNELSNCHKDAEGITLVGQSFKTQIIKIIAGWTKGLYEDVLSFKERYKLYQKILNCEIGEEENILKKNSAFIDRKFVAIMKPSFADREFLKAFYGEQKVDKLQSLATQLEDAITHWYQLEQEAEELSSRHKYAEAITISEQSLKLALQILGPEHYNVAASMNNLAQLYKYQGEYSQAESFFIEALAMIKRLLGPEHPDVATCQSNLAGLYRFQCRYSEAEPLLVEALALYNRHFGLEHHKVIDSLNNLALLYKYQGKNTQAESLYLKALEMNKTLFGPVYPIVFAISLNNLGTLYYSENKYSEAEPLLVEALALNKRLLGPEDPASVAFQSSLGELYRCQGKYSEAEPLCVEALALNKRLFGPKHPNVIGSLNNLAALLAATNCCSEALALLEQSTEIRDGMLYQMFAASSESERLAYLETIRNSFYKFLSLVNSHLSNSPEAKQAAYDLVLKRKALTAAAFAAFNYALHSDRYSHLTPQFKEWQSLRAEQIHLIYSPPLPNPEITEDEFRTHQAEYKKRLSDLETECKNLEKVLASQVPEIQLQQELETANRRAVALELPEGSTLVEFVRFDVCDFQAIPARGESQSKPARYLAFILPAKQPEKVEMIDLGEAEHIDKLLRVFRSYFSGKGDLLDMGDDDEETPTFMKYDPASGMELRKAIFDPISAVIGDSKYLLLSPDGELNLLPFQLLPDETGTRFLMDEYTISYLSVGRDILRSHFQPTRPATAPLIIADPDFDLGNEASATGKMPIPQEKSVSCGVGVSPAQSIDASYQTNQLLNTLAGNSLERAPGTRFLGEAVAKKLEVSPYFDAEALETQITTSQSPSILLIATHGVFLPDLPHQPATLESRVFGNRFSATKVENPMLRSGLALAGANIWLSGGTLPEKAGKGFLFAQDVAALDLWANELTVLSACNTAIGDVKIGEGVFGLRRAFAVAGTKTLVMSLWPVPDKATALLMERFFDNLERGFGRSNALLESQNYIRNITVRELRRSDLGREVLKELLTQNDLSCQEERPLEHPFYWGAWVCQGETTELKDVLK